MSLYFILKGVRDRCKHDCNYSLQPESAVVHINHTNYFILNIFLIFCLYTSPFTFKLQLQSFLSCKVSCSYAEIYSLVSLNTPQQIGKYRANVKDPNGIGWIFLFFSPINILFTISKG